MKKTLLVFLSAMSLTVFAAPAKSKIKKASDIESPNHACAALVTVCKEAKYTQGKDGELVKHCVSPLAASKGGQLPKGVDAKQLAQQGAVDYSSCQAALKTK